MTSINHSVLKKAEGEIESHVVTARKCELYTLILSAPLLPGRLPHVCVYEYKYETGHSVPFHVNNLYVCWIRSPSALHRSPALKLRVSRRSFLPETKTCSTFASERNRPGVPCQEHLEIRAKIVPRKSNVNKILYPSNTRFSFSGFFDS